MKRGQVNQQINERISEWIGNFCWFTVCTIGLISAAAFWVLLIGLIYSLVTHG